MCYKSNRYYPPQGFEPVYFRLNLKLHTSVEVDPSKRFQSSQVLGLRCHHSFSNCHVITPAGSEIVTTGLTF